MSISTKISKFRILHLSGRGDLSGGPIVMAKLIESLPQHDHLAVYPFEGLQDRLQDLPHCDSHHKNLHGLNLQNLFYLYRLVQANSPDLIHCHGKAAGLWGRMLGRWTGVPVIHQFHGMHWRHYPFMVQSFYFFYERWFARWTNGFVFVSHGELDEYEQWIDQSVPGAVIPNGVSEYDDTGIKRKHKLKQTLGLEPEIPVIGSITRAVYQKNLSRLLQIHGQLLLSRPAYLLLFGVRPQELNRYDLPAGQRSFVQCLFDEQNMEEKLQILDIYLSTSRWEGFSLGLLEAMANKIPAILSPVTGHLDLLPLHPKGIRLVGSNSVEEYLQIIEEWLDQPALRQEAGKVAQAYVLEKFKQQQTAAQMNEFYQNVFASLNHLYPKVQSLPDLPN